MATITFKERLIVRDTGKLKEISIALKQPRDKKIKSSQPEELPTNAGAIWFKRSEK